MGFEEWLEYLSATIWGVVFGLVGCVVGLVRRGCRGVWHVLSQLIGGGFCGWLVYMVMDGVQDIPPGWVAAACGVAGSSGGMVLDVALETLVNRIRRIGGVSCEENEAERLCEEDEVH